jgi:hypothetical protein
MPPVLKPPHSPASSEQCEHDHTGEANERVKLAKFQIAHRAETVKIIILISVLAVISFYAARARRIETADITSPTTST